MAGSGSMSREDFIKRLMEIFDLRGKITRLLINKIEIDVPDLPPQKSKPNIFFQARKGEKVLLEFTDDYKSGVKGRMKMTMGEMGVVGLDIEEVGLTPQPFVAGPLGGIRNLVKNNNFEVQNEDGTYRYWTVVSGTASREEQGTGL